VCLEVDPAAGTPLTVKSGSRVLASVDTRTWRVTEPGGRRQAARRSAATGDWTPWLLAGAAGAAILLVAAARRRRAYVARGDTVSE